MEIKAVLIRFYKESTGAGDGGWGWVGGMNMQNNLENKTWKRSLPILQS